MNNSRINPQSSNSWALRPPNKGRENVLKSCLLLGALMSKPCTQGSRPQCQDSHWPRSWWRPTHFPVQQHSLSAFNHRKQTYWSDCKPGRAGDYWVLTSEAGPLSAPGQENVTNSWQRLCTTKQQTAKERGKGGGQGEREEEAIRLLHVTTSCKITPTLPHVHWVHWRDILHRH